VTEASRGYYEESYPPSVFAGAPAGPIQVNLTAGWTAGPVAVTGTPVTIEVLQDGAPVAPTTVNWGDGTTNALLTHTYSSQLASGRISVLAGGRAGQSPVFTVIDPGTTTTGSDDPEPCPDEDDE